MAVETAAVGRTLAVGRALVLDAPLGTGGSVDSGSAAATCDGADGGSGGVSGSAAATCDGANGGCGGDSGWHSRVLQSAQTCSRRDTYADLRTDGSVDSGLAATTCLGVKGSGGSWVSVDGVTVGIR